jgi:N-dimethylarginine dimethylaminohydrolase
MTDLYLMSPPAPDWELKGRANFRSREAAAVDAKAARREWLALATAIERRGGTVVVAPPVSGLTGMPYAAECGHVVGTRFILPRMAAEHRNGEAEHWSRVAARLGFEVVALDRGTWEAQGDVAVFEHATLLFFGGRTDREGFMRARAHFTGEVIPVEIREPAFHGNMAALPLRAVDRMLVCPDVLVGDSLARLEARFGKDRLVQITEAEIRSYATNGLPIGKTLLAPSLVPDRIVDLVKSFGMDVELLAMDELCGKAGGASRCLVCHVPDPPPEIRVPDDLSLASFAA